MKLYLVRHGDAVDGYEDEKRPLSETGQQEADDVGAFLQEMNVDLDFIWHSGLLRARQTAERIAAGLQLPSDRMSEHKGLHPAEDVEPLADELDVETKNCLVVGHLPFLPELAALLLTGSENGFSIKMPTGSILCLEHIDYGGWALRFLTIPRMLKR